MLLSETLDVLRSVPPERLSLNILNSVIFQDLDQYRTAVMRVAKIPGLEGFAKSLASTSIFLTAGDSVKVDDPAHRTQIVYFANALENSAKSLRNFLESVVKPPDDDVVRIKLPDSTDFNQIVKDQDVIVKGLHQILLGSIKKDEVNIKVLSWETGSFWINLALGSAYLVGLVGTVFWAAAVIRKKKLEGDLLLRQTEKLEVEVETVKDVQQGVKKAIDLVLDAQTIAICDRFLANKDASEEIAATRRTLESFAELIHRGAEVHPALMAPEQAANLFPDFKALNSIPSQIPQLDDKPADAASDKVPE